MTPTTGRPHNTCPAPPPTSRRGTARRNGATYLGPGDVYRFLVTGAETGGAHFAMYAIVAPGGGPPPHIHRHGASDRAPP